MVAANHFASVDHPLIGIFSPRAIYYMAKKELLDMPIIGELLIWTGAFPVKRGFADREALREARRLVREGHTVGVHIEGTRQKFGYPGEVKLGGMMIAMQEGVPVIPCAVETFKWNAKTNRRACSVVWGHPISTEGLSRDRSGYTELTERGDCRGLQALAPGRRGGRKRLPARAVGRHEALPPLYLAVRHPRGASPPELRTTTSASSAGRTDSRYSCWPGT